MSTIRRILFFQQGRFSHTNAAVMAGLQPQFPEAEIRAVDLHALLKKHPALLLANSLSAGWHYGWDLLRRRRELDDAFFGTPYLFRCVHTLAQRIHADWPADLSFQTQSMFDCSTPGTPHHVYTDHTYASCRSYPAYERNIWSPTRPDWLIALERQVYDHAACVFTMSQNVANDLQRHYRVPAHRVACVGVGCNADVARLSRIGTPLERYTRRRILFVGTQWDLKGGPELLAAFYHVRKQHPDAMLTIVGVTPRVSASGVEVVGPVPVERVSDYYADASVFCLPSRIEALGIVFLEAMAAGLPVVGLRLGAAPDFILPDQTGVLVPPDDRPALAEALTNLLNDPARCRRLGTYARSLVLGKYTWDRVCATLAARMAASAVPPESVTTTTAQTHPCRSSRPAGAPPRQSRPRC